MKPMLIGLSGKAEHGKSAASRIIRDWVVNNGGTCAIFEISALILQECITLGYLPAGTIRNGQDKAQNALLILHGKARREASPNYWTDLVVWQMLSSGADVAICPNVRFPAEGGAIQAAGGTVWRINRLNADGSQFISDTRDPNDITETALDRWSADFYLTNVTPHGALLEQLVIALFEYVCGLQAK